MARYFATRKLSGLVQKDWAPVHIFSDYSPEKGFGWVDKDRSLEWFFERNDSLNPIFHQSESEPLYNMVADGLGSRKGAGAKAFPAAAKAGVTDRGGDKPQLWEGDWDVRVVGIDAIHKVSADSTVVVAVRTSEA